MQKDLKYVRAREAARILAIGRSTFWLWVKQGKLPKGIKLGNRVTVWNLEDIQNFISKAQSQIIVDL